MITVNNFFAHWVEERSVTKYGCDKELPPTFTTWELYQYSVGMIKHFPSDALKTVAKTLLYDKQPVCFAQTLYDTRNYNVTGLDVTGLSAADAAAKRSAHAKDLNIDNRIFLFPNQLKNEFVFGIPLRYLCDIGRIGFPTKIDYRIKFFLETNMNKLFESKKFLAPTATVPTADAQIVFTKAPFIQYEQILLEKILDNFLKQ